MDTGSCATPTCSPAKSLLRRHKKGLQSHGDQQLHYNQALSNLPCSSCQLHLPHRHGQRVSSAPRGTSHGLHRDLQLPQSCAHPELGTTHLRLKLSCPPTPWRRAKRHGERELRNTPHLSNLSCHSRYTQLPRNLAQRQPRTSRLLSNPSCPTLQMEVPKAPSTGASPHAPSLLALLPCHGSYRAGTRPQKKVSPPHPPSRVSLRGSLAADTTSCGQREISTTEHLPNLSFPLPQQLQVLNACAQRALHATQPFRYQRQQDNAQSPGQREPRTSKIHNLSTSSQGAANPHGEDTDTRPTRCHFSAPPCLVQASHKHQHRALRNSCHFSNTSSS